MKKIIWLLLLIIFIQEPLFAKDRIHTLLSFHLGFARATQTAPRLSSGLGINFDVQLTKTMHFNFLPAFNFRGYGGDIKVKARYLDLPFNIEFSSNKDKARALFGVGGYVGLAVKGKYKNTYTEWKKMNLGETTADNRSSLDAGLLFNFGMIAPLDNRNIMKFALQYMYGLKNVVPLARQNTPADDIKLRNFTCYLAVSIFNKKR